MPGMWFKKGGCIGSKRKRGVNMIDTDLMTAQEVADRLGVKLSMAYKLIRGWNKELRAMDKLTVQGRVNRRYFEKKLEV